MGGRHDRPKVVCAPDRDLARVRGTVLRPPSAVSSFGGFRTPAAEYAAPSLKRPASETLHISGRKPGRGQASKTRWRGSRIYRTRCGTRGLRAMAHERPSRIERRLSAIMAADVAGYSRLMHND